MVIDETERLIIKEIESSDLKAASELFEIYNNGTQSFTEDMMKSYIEYAYGFYGYGYWGLYLRETGRLIGIAGFREGSCPLEIGYAVLPDLRGKGYATEAVKSLVEFAKEDFKWVTEEGKSGKRVKAPIVMVYKNKGKVLIYGRIEKGNEASVRVLLKNGFSVSGEFDI